MTQTQTAPKRPGLKKLFLMIAAALILTYAAIYVTERLAGNGEDGAMSARTEKILEAIAPHAIGEVAAFAVSDDAKPVPAIGFIDEDGNVNDIDNWRGRLVLLNLWATWCGPCLREMPALDRLQARLGSAKFEVVAINVDKGGPEKG